MSQNVSTKLDRGLTPQQFIDAMTKNQETFLNWRDQFEWKDSGDRAFFQTLRSRDDLRCLIIAADWCGDVVRNVPVVLNVLKEAGIRTEMYIMEEHLEFIDQFLTMGGRSIPVVLLTNAAGDVLAQWGPRPRHVQAAMIQFKQQNTDRSAPDYGDNLKEARAEMARQYGEGTDYQSVIVKELREVLTAL